MPRIKRVEQNGASIPTIRNNGKVSTPTKGGAIELKNAVPLDTKPVIPNLSKMAGKKKEEQKPATKIEPPQNDEVSVMEESHSITDLKQLLVDLSCLLAKKTIGKERNFVGNPPSAAHLACIHTLLDAYKALKEKEDE